MILTDREKIEVLVDLLSERQWERETNDGISSYNYCQECGWNNKGRKSLALGLQHEPGCKIANALLFAEPLHSVVALMKRGSHILAIPRKNDNNDLGLPGGKIDATDANPEMAIVREMDEEIGCKPLVLFPVFEHLDRVEGDQRKPCRCFFVLEWEGEPRAKEGPEPLWVPPGRLLEPSCSFAEYNRRLFQAVLPSVA